MMTHHTTPHFHQKSQNRLVLKRLLHWYKITIAALCVCWRPNFEAFLSFFPLVYPCGVIFHLAKLSTMLTNLECQPSCLKV